MRRYSETVKAQMKRRMGPPQRQSFAQIYKESASMPSPSTTGGITGVCWGKRVKTSSKDPEGWSAADKFTLVLVTAGLNATELSAYCRELGLFPEQVDRWRKAAEDANA
jgi:hypothetical protein